MVAQISRPYWTAARAAAKNVEGRPKQGGTHRVRTLFSGVQEKEIELTEQPEF